MRWRIGLGLILCACVVLVELYALREPPIDHDKGLDEIYDDLPHVTNDLHALNAELKQLEAPRRDSARSPYYVVARRSYR